MRCPNHKKKLIAQDITIQGLPFGYCEYCHTRWYKLGDRLFKEDEFLRLSNLIEQIGNPSFKRDKIEYH